MKNSNTIAEGGVALHGCRLVGELGELGLLCKFDDLRLVSQHPVGHWLGSKWSPEFSKIVYYVGAAAF